ncbi:MAG TPA: XRE family transcriptional regulator [Spongiibacteraceae bacterium]|nr:transcriptional regulator [Spongiibacteraceae bacterium]HCS28449.1 XRE family transcriptional regulator [Spongiibacteraceae bacterium]|tara:strand:- start:303 stop:1139 length:837 start_codon:yes stop_codon:yes gene_type:complete
MSEQDSEPAFGRFLKFWRSVHEVSQEELGFRLDSSPRHISRIENGSSRPSEAIILEIGRVLELGNRDLNHMLIAAGYAPREDKVDFHAPELKWLRKAMTLNLRALDPYPASLLDRSSNLLMVNRGWVSFYSHIVSRQELANVSNFYDFVFSRQGAGNAVSNWEDTLSGILMSFQQAALFTNDPQDRVTLERLGAYPSVPDDWRKRAARFEPMASFRVQLRINGALHRFFSVNTNVGALGPAAFLSEPRLTLNTLYPEDDGLDLDSLIDESLEHPLLFY